MQSGERDASILEHIIQYCEEIEATAIRFGNSYEAFSADSAYRNACALCILQIGELAGHLSDDFRQAHRTVPWQSIRGLRNIVAHAYGSLNVESTWKTIEEDIPELKQYCLKIQPHNSK